MYLQQDKEQEQIKANIYKGCAELLLL